MKVAGRNQRRNFNHEKETYLLCALNWHSGAKQYPFGR
jgi:hypothetical protein